jgi:hypothetical protein
MNYTAIKTDSADARNYIILDASGEAVKYKDEIVTFLSHDAIEIAGRLTAGAEISAFFVNDRDDYYGSPLHAELGDSWFFANCSEAW